MVTVSVNVRHVSKARETSVKITALVKVFLTAMIVLLVQRLGRHWRLAPQVPAKPRRLGRLGARAAYQAGYYSQGAGAEGAGGGERWSRPSRGLM